MAKHSNNHDVAASARRMRARNVRIAKALAFVIVMAAAFVGGFAVRGNDALLDRLGLQTLTGDADAASKAAQADNVYNSLGARVGEVEDVIATDSLDSFELDAATSKVLDAFAASTEDPYLRYYDPARYATLLQGGGGQYAGVGVLFSEYDGRAYAVDVFEDSPAQASDVREGDFVVAIDGDRSHSWTASEVAAALNRDAGEDAVITWRRASSLDDLGGAEFTTTLSVSRDTIKNVTSELSGQVGYIQLRQITQNAADLVKAAIADLESQGAAAFVLDVRDDPGGYLTQAVDVASLFVKSGAIVRIETQGSEVNTKNATGATATDKPLVVLVNGNTASSAEVLAAALQDNQRATLVGATTLGKGSVQVTHDLSFGGALRYTAAYYKTPLDRDIDGVGVVPDISVGLSADSDNQKDLAIETAQSLVRE